MLGRAATAILTVRRACTGEVRLGDAAIAVGGAGTAHPRMQLQRLTGLEQDKITGEYKG